MADKLFFSVDVIRDATELAEMVFSVDASRYSALSSNREKLYEYLQECAEKHLTENAEKLAWEPVGDGQNPEVNAWSSLDFKKQTFFDYQKNKLKENASLQMVSKEDRVVPRKILEEAMDTIVTLQKALLDKGEMLQGDLLKSSRRLNEALARIATSGPEGSNSRREAIEMALGEIYLDVHRERPADEYTHEQAVEAMGEWLELNAPWEWNSDDLLKRGVLEGQKLLIEKQVSQQESKRTENVIVFGVSDGVVAKLYPVSVTDEEYDLGIHYDLAEEAARQDGISAPLILFDEHESRNLECAQNTLKVLGEQDQKPVTVLLGHNASGCADVILLDGLGSATNENMAESIAEDEGYEKPFLRVEPRHIEHALALKNSHASEREAEVEYSSFDAPGL